ncbi:hypothetical protein Sjap_023707 [Stephania japonica]|uniref:NADP-dependent oxidoreductase domain-containing protein n=1 Tax=Stephania japonica TaxID=461633 RepID=A0AAP0EE82_9MAGN
MEEILARSGERGLPARSRQATRIGTPRSKALGPDPRSTVVVPCHLRLPKKDWLQSVRRSDPATPEQSVDDEAVYLNVADAGCGAAGRVRCRCGATTKGYELHASKHLGMDMDEIGLAQEQPPPPPPPPPPHDQRMPPQIDPADPPQQGDNVGRETTPCLGGRRGGYIVEASELGGGYGGFGAGGLGAYRVALPRDGSDDGSCGVPILDGFRSKGGKGTVWGTDRVMESQVLKEIGISRGKTHAQVCLRWVHEQGVVLLVKSFNEERMKENLDISGWELSEKDSKKIDEIPQSRGLPGDVFVSDDGPFKTETVLWDGDL